MAKKVALQQNLTQGYRLGKYSIQLEFASHKIVQLCVLQLSIMAKKGLNLSITYTSMSWAEDKWAGPLANL